MSSNAHLACVNPLKNKVFCFRMLIYEKSKWCPGADLNHRHADFQSSVEDVNSSTYEKSAVKLGSGKQALTDELSNSRVERKHSRREGFSPEIEMAARWYEANRNTLTRPAVAMLRDMFSLTARQAIEAIRIANGGGA
ncbi:hypothetical protein [Oricola sp.]|uniref:hypothetical protein n=1 Tax=Oricola sp. TaxID=1979950 RepID=UPI0025DCA3F6|nr:hypothetical protein [Oricola sp.]MCI5078253.1 hypothetical protein [Oricola sp.]